MAHLPVFPEQVRIEVELSGIGGGWTELPDIQSSAAIAISRGLGGTSQRDRVAATGTMSFQLDNSANNSQGLLGLYSLNHANRLVGWETGIGVRCIVRYNEVDEPLFYGTVDTIEPVSGKYGPRKVNVSCVDWMEEAALAKVGGLAMLLNKRSDEVFTVLMGSVSRQPPNGFVAQTGGDTYPYALDTALEGSASVMTELQQLAQSELGRVYVRRDGAVVFESRHKRPNLQVPSISFTDEEIEALETGRGRSEIINHVEIQAHPRRVASAVAVLFVLANKPQIMRSTSLPVDALFRDPDARATRVGGIDVLTPVAITDFLFNTAEDGSGTNITSQLSVSAVYSANGGTITVVNNGPEDGYLTLLQCRGIGVYAYETVLVRADSQASKDKYGARDFGLDMPYQSDLAVAQDAADFIVQQSKALLTSIRAVSFQANREAQLMLAALRYDISTRVRLEETVTGAEPVVPVDETQAVAVTDFFINAVSLEIWERGIVRCTWTLAPADPFSYWMLERDGYTELGITTRLAYGSFIAGWVLDDSVLGTGTRVNQ